MTTHDPDRHTAGFRDRTPLASARAELADRIVPIQDDERIELGLADGRVLAESVAAERDVPAHRRAAMDGYAIHSDDAAGATDRSPVVLEAIGAEEHRDELPAEHPDDPPEEHPDDPPEEHPDQVAASATARRVHTGSAVPADADAVVPIEHVTALGERIELTAPVAPGENVAPVGEDVQGGQPLYEPGHRLRPSDLGLLKAAGIDRVAVRRRPTVGVVPTGEELVQHDPGPGQAVETNGLTVSRLVDRWGARAEYRNVVSDDVDALRAAIQRDLTKDVIVTTGGTSVGERDLLPEVVADLGEVLVHGVALQPGHPVAIGIVEETPVLCLPGYPVSCIVTAVQLLRPALHRLVGTEPEQPPTQPATLTRKLESEPGTRTYARVELDTEDGQTVARPTRTRGAGVLSSVALADGWVEIEPGVEGLPEGELVAVQDWEWLP